jgi:hypothetical protein
VATALIAMRVAGVAYAVEERIVGTVERIELTSTVSALLKVRLDGSRLVGGEFVTNPGGNLQVAEVV